MLTQIVFVIIAYLLGSIPFGYLLVKYVFTEGEDVRRVGSGGTGATNVTRRAGRSAGLLDLPLRRCQRRGFGHSYETGYGRLFLGRRGGNRRGSGPHLPGLSSLSRRQRGGRRHGRVPAR